MLSRSLLFVPANKEKKLLKINQLQADIILIDLEDAIPLQDKPLARTLLRNHFPNIKKPVFVRINSIDTNEFEKDIQLIRTIASNPYVKGIILPKASSKMDIIELSNQLDAIDMEHERSHHLFLIPLIESALGVKHALEIASADDRVVRLAFGGFDYVSDIDAIATDDEQELLYARSEIVIASRCAQLQKPIDTVFVDIHDTARFENRCHYAKSLGFAGKLVIHPIQIDVANRVFSPSPKEVEEAEQIMTSITKHNHEGVFQMNGKMVDKPIIDKAKRILEEYQSIKDFHQEEV